MIYINEIFFPLSLTNFCQILKIKNNQLSWLLLQIKDSNCYELVYDSRVNTPKKETTTNVIWKVR